MFPARPTPRSSRRAVAAARSDPPRTVAEADVPCPRFQARGFLPEAQPTQLALRSGHTAPVPGPHSEVTAPPYTPQPRARASFRIRCRPYRTRSHAHTPPVPDFEVVTMHEPPQSHTASQQPRIHYDSSTRNRNISPHTPKPAPSHAAKPPRPAQERIAASDGYPTRLLSSIFGQPPAPRFPAPFEQRPITPPLGSEPTPRFPNPFG